MKTNTITINGKEYRVKYTIRALFIWEQIMKRPFKVETMLDTYALFYAILLANNENDVLDWNEFLDALDADPNLFNVLNEKVNETTKVDALMEDDEPEGNKGDVKKN